MNEYPIFSSGGAGKLRWFHMNRLIDDVTRLKRLVRALESKIRKRREPRKWATIPVLVTQTGGSAGNLTTQCSFTYTVKNRQGTTLLTGAAQIRPRPSVGAMVAQSADSIGIALYDETGTLVLWDAGEVPDPEGCP